MVHQTPVLVKMDNELFEKVNKDVQRLKDAHRWINRNRWINDAIRYYLNERKRFW